jgi:hypothetical protein
MYLQMRTPPETTEVDGVVVEADELLPPPQPPDAQHV